MKKVRYYRLICLLMAIAVMISGICLEKIPVNSYFSCKQVNAITSSSYSLKTVSIFKTETLSQREILSSIRSTRREARKVSDRERNRTAEFCLVFTDFFPKDFDLSTWKTEERRYNTTLCSLSILNYIHNQDGEKA